MLYKYVFFITLTTTKPFMQSTTVQQVFEEQSITLINFQSTKWTTHKITKKLHWSASTDPEVNIIISWKMNGRIWQFGIPLQQDAALLLPSGTTKKACKKVASEIWTQSEAPTCTSLDRFLPSVKHGGSWSSSRSMLWNSSMVSLLDGVSSNSVNLAITNAHQIQLRRTSSFSCLALD